MEILAIWRISVTRNSAIQILKCLQIYTSVYGSFRWLKETKRISLHRDKTSNWKHFLDPVK
jgi:hypothetical protein